MTENHLNLFDVAEEEIIDKALTALDIQQINYKDDNETNKIIAILIAVDCIINGPFTISKEKMKSIQDKIYNLSIMIPKSSVVNDYPKAIQLRSMIEKMKDDFDETEVVYHIEKVIGTGD